MSAAPPERPAATPLSAAKLAALAELCRRFHVRTLDVFGSAATGRFDPARSDLDFLVAFDEAAVEDRHPWLDFHLEVEGLFGRHVDILNEASLTNPFLRRSVEATRRRLFPPGSDDRQGPIDPAMSDKQPAKYLWDALQAAEWVERFTRGRTFDNCLSDEMLRFAVERQLQVLGEALAALRRADQPLGAQIPELPQVVGFRNIVVHNYAQIDNDQVWKVIERDLPNLRRRLAQLLAEAGGS